MNKTKLTDCCHHIDHVQIVDLLIQKGADINNKGDNDKTPLMLVAGQGNHNKLFIANCIHMRMEKQWCAFNVNVSSFFT